MHRLFRVVYSLIAILFALCAIALVVFAFIELLHGLNFSAPVEMKERFSSILESIGLLTIAVAALELSQTVVEEEVQRSASMSAPTRVRRFLSRFLVVVVVSLSIECLVAVFQISHGDLSLLPYAASIGIGAAALLGGWGAFVHLNTSAEKLEPEAMEQVKEEDEKLS